MRCLSTLLLAVCLPMTALAESNRAAPSLDGVWQTGARDGSWGYVTFGPCGSAVCGTLVGGGGDNVQTQHFGRVIITGMQWTGTQFAGGQVTDVEKGHVYRAKMRLQDDGSLRVSGCVLGGLICAGQTWVRVE